MQSSQKIFASAKISPIPFAAVTGHASRLTAVCFTCHALCDPQALLAAAARLNPNP
ncbi:hypothetical protein SAMN05216316_3058 [Nitrosovibrio sp. Nv6]|nr:hypothetical protein SAMN05216316_3058 [Nitrosovibrio sp. Nv6]